MTKIECTNPEPKFSLDEPGRRSFNVCATCHRNASFAESGTVRHCTTAKAVIAKRQAAA